MIQMDLFTVVLAIYSRFHKANAKVRPAGFSPADSEKNLFLSSSRWLAESNVSWLQN